MAARACIFAALLLLAAMLSVSHAAAQSEVRRELPREGQRLAVIVHPSRLDAVDRAMLAQIYLKRRRFWQDGEPIVPVNREGTSTDRTRFSARIFGDGARRLDGYWNRRYFQGVLPPATLASAEAVRRFVAVERKAIGYVPEGLVDASVRVVLLLEPD